ncbi:MAG: histidine kinase, partial [Chitinophagales bacterium]
IAICYQNIGTCFLDHGNNNDGIKNTNIAIDLYRSIHKYRELASLYCNFAITYISLGKYPEGLSYTDSAINIYNKLNDTNAMYIPFGIFAQYYFGKHKYDSAIYYFTKSLKIAVNTGNKREQVFLFTNLGVCNENIGKYAIAEKFYKQALPLAREVSYKSIFYEVPYRLALMYAKMHDYKNAFLYYNTAYNSRDSIRNEEKEKAMAEMTARFNNNELENKNKLLQKENDIEQVRLQRKNIFVYSGYGAAILFLVIGMLIVRQNRLKANQQRMELEQKQLLAQINPHFIFNCLNSIQQFVVQNDTMNANKYLADFALLMRQTLDNSKDGNISLRREIEYLENYLSFEHMRFEDKFSYTVQFAPDINIDTTEIPSMIIQPFVENAIRHGLINLETRKGLLNISFYKKEGFLYCEVDDNGIGMEEAQKLKGQTFIKYQSHGMELTRQRLALVSKMHSKDYTIKISNKIGQDQTPEGTTIIIKFPLQA